MSKPYDATTKELLEAYPADWVRWLGLGKAPEVELINADVSTITAAADKVLLVKGRPGYVVHLARQANRQDQMARRVLSIMFC